MARIEDQGLLIAHLSQVLHGQPVLGPVLKYGTIAAIGDQLFRMLGYPGIQVVGKHQHNGSSLTGTVRIGLQVPGVYGVRWLVTVHVDPAIGLQLPGKFRQERGMVLFGNIPECIPQSQLLFFRAQNILSPGCMVKFPVRFNRGRKISGNPFQDGLFERFTFHMICLAVNQKYKKQEPAGMLQGGYITHSTPTCTTGKLVDNSPIFCRTAPEKRDIAYIYSF